MNYVSWLCLLAEVLHIDAAIANAPNSTASLLMAILSKLRGSAHECSMGPLIVPTVLKEHYLLVFRPLGMGTKGAMALALAIEL